MNGQKIAYWQINDNPGIEVIVFEWINRLHKYICAVVLLAGLSQPYRQAEINGTLPAPRPPRARFDDFVESIYKEM